MHEATAQLERQRRLELEVRIGINSGEVLTGTIGERYSRHYTACGYTVALAKRMETLARPGGIYLTEHTAALIGQALELSDLGLFEVKGALSPVGVFELIGPRQERGVESLRVAVQGELPHRFTASRVAAAGARSG